MADPALAAMLIDVDANALQDGGVEAEPVVRAKGAYRCWAFDAGKLACHTSTDSETVHHVPMNLTTALSKLEALGNEKVRARNLKRGAGDMPQFGVQLGHVRKLAKEIGADHELALELWGTGNIDARQLAILLMNPKELTRNQLDELVRDPGFVNVFDWLDSYIVRKHPDKEAMRQEWLNDSNPWAARAGWSLTAERIGKQPEGLDLPGLLDRIEREMAAAPAETQWTMNNSLAGIGIHHAELRQRAVDLGEHLGVFRDYPTPKGCTSPFAPIWIAEMVRRQESA